MRAPGWVAAGLALAVLAAPGAAPFGDGAAVAQGAQAPGGGPGEVRVVSFSWTLYPRMWAEVDLRLAPGAEAVAEIVAEGGDASWNLHSHPADAAPSAFVVLAQGSGGRATVRCAPTDAGLYSYLVGNDRAPGPVRVRIDLRLTGDAALLGVRP